MRRRGDCCLTTSKQTPNNVCCFKVCLGFLGGRFVFKTKFAMNQPCLQSKTCFKFEGSTSALNTTKQHKTTITRSKLGWAVPSLGEVWFSYPCFTWWETVVPFPFKRTLRSFSIYTKKLSSICQLIYQNWVYFPFT